MKRNNLRYIQKEADRIRQEIITKVQNSNIHAFHSY